MGTKKLEVELPEEILSHLGEDSPKKKDLIPEVKTSLNRLMKEEYRISQELFKTFHSCKPKEEKLRTVIKYCNKGA